MELIRQPKIENVRMMDRLTSITNAKAGNGVSGVTGTLYLTPTHLIFVDHEGKNETWVLHSHLSSIDKLSISSLGSPLQIKCKNFQSITFILPKEKDAHEVWTSLYNLSQPLSYNDLYCFRYSASNEPFKDDRTRGWNSFDLYQEFQRQGLPNNVWVMTTLNEDYALCETYPRILIVPSFASEAVLKASAGFRSKGRLPVLSYLNKNGAVICRCSQPLSGFNSRSEEDEQLLNCILKSSPDPESKAPKVLYVVDTRPRVSGILTSLLLSSCHYYYSGSSLTTNFLNNKSSSAVMLSILGGSSRRLAEDKKLPSRQVSSSPASRSSSPSVTPLLRPNTACGNSSGSTDDSKSKQQYLSDSSDSSPKKSSCAQMITKRKRKRNKKKSRRRHDSERDTNGNHEYHDNNYHHQHSKRRHRHRDIYPKSDATTTTTTEQSRSPSPLIDSTTNHDKNTISATKTTKSSVKSTITVDSSSNVNATSSSSSRLTSNHFLSSMMNKLKERSNATTDFRLSSSLPLSSSESTKKHQPKQIASQSKVNAYAQKAAGKGYENENFYENIKFNFFGIENIHVMRSSLNKLLEASEMFNNSSDAFISAVEASGWLKHIKSVLEAAAFVVKAVQDGISCVVHCSDGWDRTAQTCALSSLLLDPYHRSIKGFQALIEREWLSFGHKFTERCGHIQTGDPKETSPIFTQFLDCIWQILQQFPTEFEFNEKFLLLLHDHVYSCQFGTFIGNNDKERHFDLKIEERTYSLWAFMDVRRDTLTNPLYYVKRRTALGGSDNLNEKVLVIDTSPQVIKFWRNFYNRFESGIHPREEISDVMEVTYNHIVSLERHVKFLEMKLKEAESRKKAKLLEIQHQHLHQNIDVIESKGDNLLEPPSGSSKKLSSSSKGSSSFDSIDFPLKIVKQCMERLEIKQREDEEKAREELEKQSLPSKLTATTVDSHPLDPLSFESSPSPTPPSSRLARENLRLNDLKIAYPEGRNVSSVTEKTATNSVKKDDFDSHLLRKDMLSVAVEWESLRSCQECVCGFPFSQRTPRNHCYSCGRLHCQRCIDRKILLPGHQVKDNINNIDSSGSEDVFESPTIIPSAISETETVSVCRSCYKTLLDKDSFTSPS